MSTTNPKNNKIMRHINTFKGFLNESLNENAKRQGIMDKVAVLAKNRLFA